MRQRIGFAVALVGNRRYSSSTSHERPRPRRRRMIRDLIMRCRDEKTIFFSSHVMGDVEQICDRVSILVKGKLTHCAALTSCSATT